MEKEDDRKYEKKGDYPAERSITDIICCIFFLACTGFAIFLAFYGFIKGNPKNIMQPYDSSGNACGRGDVANYPFLYLTTVNPKEWTKRNACVKACPESESSNVECFTNAEITNCDSLESKKAYNFGNRFCVPSQAMEAATATAKASAAGFSFGHTFETFQREAYGDVIDAWQVFLVSIVVAIIISIIYLCLLETCALTMIIGMMIAMLVALGLLGLLFFRSYQTTQTDADPKNDNDKLYLYLAYVTWGVTAILTCCFCCLYSQINLAAKIIEATADYITDYSRIIIVPIITLAMLIAYLIWWMYSGAYIFSIGTLEYNGQYPWGEVKWTKLQK